MEFLVARDDLRRFVVRDAPVPDIVAGQARLRIELFALTANNITYAAFGDLMSYWSFFPAPDGWGRVPVWGYAEVEASQVDGLVEGERIYGYFPMASYLVVDPGHLTANGFVDTAAHRAKLPPVYNQYQRVASGRGAAAQEAYQALLRPLFTTSFLIDDWLADNGLFGARQVVVASASSKTALGLAYLLAANERAEVIGLTAAANAAFVAGVGYYDRTVVYGGIGTEAADVPTVLVDMAGDAKVLAEVHGHFGPSLTHSCRVGATHWEELAPVATLPGPTPSLFFAPDHVVKRRADWGGRGFDERLGNAWEGFVASASSWLEVVEGHGPDAVAHAYLEVLEGRARPDQGHVLSL